MNQAKYKPIGHWVTPAVYSHWFPAKTCTRVTDRCILKPWLVDHPSVRLIWPRNFACICAAAFFMQKHCSACNKHSAAAFQKAPWPQIHREDAINLQLPLLSGSWIVLNVLYTAAILVPSCISSIKSVFISRLSFGQSSARVVNRRLSRFHQGSSSPRSVKLPQLLLRNDWPPQTLTHALTLH